MSFFTRYLQILLGGPLTISRNKLEPGHIVSFRYRSEASNRKLNRIALVLGKFNKGNGMMIHALNIENIPPENFIPPLYETSLFKLSSSSHLMIPSTQKYRHTTMKKTS